MSYSFNSITTAADCDALLLLANRESVNTHRNGHLVFQNTYLLDLKNPFLSRRVFLEALRRLRFPPDIFTAEGLVL